MKTRRRFKAPFLVDLLAVVQFFLFLSYAVAAGPDADSDGDGIPDLWEVEHGMNPNDARDAQLDYDLSGFSNLERYNGGHPPGRDIVAYEEHGLMKPVYSWSRDEMISYLDSVATAGQFFRVVEYRYGSVSGSNEVVNALKRIRLQGLDALGPHLSGTAISCHRQTSRGWKSEVFMKLSP